MIREQHPDLRIHIAHGGPGVTVPRPLARDFIFVLVEEYPDAVTSDPQGH